jgi:hypothetical protein
VCERVAEVGTRRERQEWEGRRREREGAGGDARIVRRSNTCGEMIERKRREWGEIWSEDGREMDERNKEEERKNRETRGVRENNKLLFLCLCFVIRNPKARRAK